MSFLHELQQKRDKLKPTQTIITRSDDNKPDYIPACILDEGLFLGSQDSVTIENLEKYKIDHILSIGIEIDNIEITAENYVKFIPCLDLPETELDNILPTANKYITTVLQTGGKVLVHCNAGVSRSTAVVIGYLILERKMSFEEAFKLVKSKRECIQPNAGFIQQLKQLKQKN